MRVKPAISRYSGTTGSIPGWWGWKDNGERDRPDISAGDTFMKVERSEAKTVEANDYEGNTPMMRHLRSGVVMPLPSETQHPYFDLA